MRSALADIKQLLDMFEDCRAHVGAHHSSLQLVGSDTAVTQIAESPVHEEHLLSFNKTILNLGSCKLKTEQIYIHLMERACIPKVESLMKRDAGWEDLQLHSRLRIYLKDDWESFKEAIDCLGGHLGYFKRKLSISAVRPTPTVRGLL